MKAHGFTLIELIASLLIISITMMGFYAMLSTIVEFSFHPERVLQAINHLEVYQQKINTLHIPKDCHQPGDLKPLLEHWCGVEKNKPFTFTVKNSYQQSQIVHVESTPFEANSNLVWLQLTMQEDDKLVYSTRVLRAIHE